MEASADSAMAGPRALEDTAPGWGAQGHRETGDRVLTEASLGHTNPLENMPPAPHSVARHLGPGAPWAGLRTPSLTLSLMKIEKQV